MRGSSRIAGVIGVHVLASMALIGSVSCAGSPASDHSSGSTTASGSSGMSSSGSTASGSSGMPTSGTSASGWSSTGTSGSGTTTTGSVSGTSGAPADASSADVASRPTDAGDAGSCGPRSFQCSGPCVCNPGYVIDRMFSTQVSLASACDLQKQAWPNGGNIPVAACQSACANVAARNCEVAAGFYSAFQSANAGAGPDASFVCPPAPDGSATVSVTCDVEHFAAVATCQWTQCMP